MTIYKLMGSAPAGVTTDSLATIDIQNDGHIVAIAMMAAPEGMDALGDFYWAEVSFMSTSTFANNDVRGSLLMLAAFQNFLTTGGGGGGGQANLSGVRLPVAAGERIHLHTFMDTGVSGRVQVYLYIEDGVGDSKPKRRLR